MNNKIIKTLIIIGMILMIVLLPIVVCASTPIDLIQPNKNELEVPISNANKWRSRILLIVQIVGSVIAVIMLMVLGVKYMMASAEGKADIKKQVIIYVVGAVLLFGAANIAGMFRGLASSL